MPVFFGKMREPDSEDLFPAVVTVEKGNIRLVSGQTRLGEWKMQQVVLRDRGDETVSFTADDHEIILVLQEHESFLAETATHRRDESDRRRSSYVHPAFRTEEDEPGPMISDEFREEVSKEVGSVTDEIRELWRLVAGSGPALWAGLAIVAALIVFAPSVLVIIGLGGGVLALIAGAITYADDNLAVRIPDPLSPVRLIAIGVVLVVVGIVVALIR